MSRPFLFTYNRLEAKINNITIVKKGISLSLFVGDLEVVHKEAKAEAVFQHFKGILGARRTMHCITGLQPVREKHYPRKRNRRHYVWRHYFENRLQ